MEKEMKEDDEELEVISKKIENLNDIVEQAKKEINNK